MRKFFTETFNYVGIICSTILITTILTLWDKTAGYILISIAGIIGIASAFIYQMKKVDDTSSLAKPLKRAIRSFEGNISELCNLVLMTRNDEDRKASLIKLSAAINSFSSYLRDYMYEKDIDKLKELETRYANRFLKITTDLCVFYIYAEKIEIVSSGKKYFVGTSVSSGSYGITKGSNEWIEIPEDESKITIFENEDDFTKDLSPLIETLLQAVIKKKK